VTRLRIQGARILDPASGRDEIGSVDVVDGRIEAIGAEASGVPDEVIEAGGLWLAPGFVDLHAHLREPGQEYQEDIETAPRPVATRPCVAWRTRIR
jgi:dihydroorotase